MHTGDCHSRLGSCGVGGCTHPATQCQPLAVRSRRRSTCAQDCRHLDPPRTHSSRADSSTHSVFVFDSQVLRNQNKSGESRFHHGHLTILSARCPQMLPAGLLPWTRMGHYLVPLRAASRCGGAQTLRWGMVSLPPARCTAVSWWVFTWESASHSTIGGYGTARSETG